MKRKIIIFLSFILCNSLIFGQDIIKKKSLEEIKCKVIEVTPDLVKYKKYNDLDGPVYELPFSEVFVIRYENRKNELLNNADSTRTGENPPLLSFTNGFFGPVILEGKRRLSGSEVRQIYSNHPGALKKYNSGTTRAIIGNLIGVPCAFVFGWQLGTSVAGGDANSSVFAISGIGFVGGMILAMTGDVAIKKSVDIYNSEVQTPLAHLDFGITQNGIGLCLRF